MAIISIIVPVYNVAPYLSKCVDSLVYQSLHDIEIILVDDGSTDNSNKICDEYALKDDRIKVIHKKNGGLSDARNAGLEICTGTYIGFVDGDDYVSHDMYKVLYHNAIEFQADVVGCQLVNISDKKIFKPEKKDMVLYNQSQMIKQLFFVGGSLSVCNKIFKKHIFEDLRFDVNKYHEDAYIVLKWIEKTKRFVIINDGLYYYMHREDSITESDFSIKRLDLIRAYKYDLEIIKKSYPDVIDYGELRLWWAYRNVLECILKSKKTNQTRCIYNKIKKILIKNIFCILTNPVMPKKQKVAYILILFSHRLYMHMKK
jgi:glycosyltransferase involved in cell wall biosynthesis